jgi:hypothetical protein
VIDAASMSGAMNALSFSEHVQGLMLWRVIGLNLAIVLDAPFFFGSYNRAGGGACPVQSNTQDSGDIICGFRARRWALFT